MSRGAARRREPRKRVRRATDLIPLPTHPYRNSAIFYGFLSACLVVITYLTAGGIVRAVIVASGFFVIATGFSWWKFRAKLAVREEEGR